MENMTTLRVDLGINAQKIAQQVMIHNEAIEIQISKGIQLALDEITVEDNFISLVKEGTKESILQAINQATNSWEFKRKVSDAINLKLENKINEYANEVAEKVFKDL